jgi:uncharacterized Zn finger protein (UPF0148 family)
MLKYICDRCGAVIEKTDGTICVVVHNSVVAAFSSEEKRLDLCPTCAEAAKIWFNLKTRPAPEKPEEDVPEPPADIPKDDERMTRNGPMTSPAWAAFFAVTANWVLTYFREHGIYPVTGYKKQGRDKLGRKTKSLVYQLTNGEFNALCEAVKAHKKRTGKPAGHEEEA